MLEKKGLFAQPIVLHRAQPATPNGKGSTLDLYPVILCDLYVAANDKLLMAALSLPNQQIKRATQK